MYTAVVGSAGHVVLEAGHSRALRFLCLIPLWRENLREGPRGGERLNLKRASREVAARPPAIHEPRRELVWEPPLVMAARSLPLTFQPAPAVVGDDPPRGPPRRRSIQEKDFSPARLIIHKAFKPSW